MILENGMFKKFNIYKAQSLYQNVGNIWKHNSYNWIILDWPFQKPFAMIYFTEQISFYVQKLSVWMIFPTSVGGHPVAVGDRYPADPAVRPLGLGVRQSDPVVVCLVGHIRRQERLSEPVKKHSGIAHTKSSWLQLITVKHA